MTPTTSPSSSMVSDAQIAVTGLRSLVYEGEEIAFTDEVSGMPTLGSYDIDGSRLWLGSR